MPGFASPSSPTADLIMYVVGRSATYTTQLLISLIVTNSALPTTSYVPELTTDFPTNETKSSDNGSIIHLPKGISWSPEIPSFQTSVPYRVPDTAITLNFTHFGSKIPVLRALSTIYDASKQVLSHLASNSEDAIKKDTFEYSTRFAPRAPRFCSVVVQAYRGLGLSWLQLDQILEGLTQFCSGAGVDLRVHYQALEFEVNLSDEGRIGIGLLWCTPGQGQGASEVEERAEITAASRELDKRGELGLANKTSATIFNGSSLPSTSAPEVSFPVPGTNINLAFIWLGNPIPSKKVNEALDCAFKKIAPFLIKSDREHIPHNAFFYSTPAEKVQIAIQIYGMIEMNWAQVDAVIAGLFRFTHGIGTLHQETHFKNLEFDIQDAENRQTIGYGNLLATPITGLNTARAINEKSSPRTLTLTSPSLLNSTLPPHTYPVPSTTLTLLFTYMGPPLPASEVNTAIRNARRRIAPAARYVPDRDIPEEGFEHHEGTVQVDVKAYEGSEITWRRLGQVLAGLAGFCVVAYKRFLVFEVEVEGKGRVGSGRLWAWDGVGGGVG